MMIVKHIALVGCVVASACFTTNAQSAEVTPLNYNHAKYNTCMDAKKWPCLKVRGGTVTAKQAWAMRNKSKTERKTPIEMASRHNHAQYDSVWGE